LKLDDPDAVRKDYESEQRLEARASVYRWATGPDALSLCVEAVAEAEPRRVLDVGCGRGNIAERIARESEAVVLGLDQSERMVELTRSRGVDAVVGDVRALPFEDGDLDCVLAAWMLFHVPDVDAALAEVARVLRPGGRLVAVTNGRDHHRELYELLDREPPEASFSAENGEELLGRHFGSVEARDASGTVRFPDRAAAQAFVDAMIVLDGTLPAFDGPLVCSRRTSVFVAET
jgi:SAM-dependent methyltransferase